MSILITGGAGYIGSHTCVELLEAGHDVVIVDNFSNSNPESIKKIEETAGKILKIYNINILDKERLNRVFLENDINSVVHFAGFKAVGESVKYPLEYYRNNILSTLNLCEVMREHNVKKIVFSSSATVYGMNNKSPLTESLNLSATNPYGWTKLMVEQILKDLYISDKEWSISILRYFNPVGAHESGKIGENPNGIPDNLMPLITKVAKGDLEKLYVFGDDYNTVDGTGVRDYIHVVDLARGHLKAIEKLKKGVSIYNLGTGKGTSVLELINTFIEINNIDISYEITERRLGDIGICYADPSKAKEELGWHAKKNIEDMVKDAWEFEKQNK